MLEVFDHCWVALLLLVGQRGSVVSVVEETAHLMVVRKQKERKGLVSMSFQKHPQITSLPPTKPYFYIDSATSHSTTG